MLHQQEDSSFMKYNYEASILSTIKYRTIYACLPVTLMGRWLHGLMTEWPGPWVAELQNRISFKAGMKKVTSK